MLIRTPMPYDRDYFCAAHERTFLRLLAEKNPSAYAKYAAIITSGLRAYDATVDVAEVRRAIAEMR
jgi:hypothetical protein